MLYYKKAYGYETQLNGDFDAVSETLRQSIEGIKNSESPFRVQYMHYTEPYVLKIENYKQEHVVEECPDEVFELSEKYQFIANLRAKRVDDEKPIVLVCDEHRIEFNSDAIEDFDTYMLPSRYAKVTTLRFENVKEMEFDSYEFELPESVANDTTHAMLTNLKLDCKLSTGIVYASPPEVPLLTVSGDELARLKEEAAAAAASVATLESVDESTSESASSESA